jgi:hypothetical protein
MHNGVLLRTSVSWFLMFSLQMLASPVFFRFFLNFVFFGEQISCGEPCVFINGSSNSKSMDRVNYKTVLWRKAENVVSRLDRNMQESVANCF